MFKKYALIWVNIHRIQIKSSSPTLDPEQVSLSEYMQYEQHVKWIQNTVSNLIIL